ncbi:MULTISPECIES: MerR family transcriptional regulator [Rossellomorea]|uniref:MerR family transcriptional regulator n=2 Tax=Rossellomorea vietnamensis TaxID=218284 RepID=A0ACD4C4Q0_9BACI|nr:MULTISPECIES: MerR family transcriptional regulator [Rossellomorea]OXS61525.1 MerR family transcriptional regulator [Bacillus sp. DSM 27956]PRX77151.1 transcriptional regulator [Bacillus sp. V-88]MCA0150626.1 MerR family transcriptional regulator [Rossellomorea vietnamensis]MCC5802076.1 MerR family transcriptional regulator [Rossellomorea vietnamensis]QHE63132.1 MerR family transcriptional regulator [Rossellomorea vietnamensis]
MDNEPSYKDKKVISIGVVSELTGLTERKIRYYEEKNLIFPQRSNRGYRKYSFSDVERLMDIADQREEGVTTKEIKHELTIKERKEAKKKMIKGQLNAQFGVQKK